jgi:heme-degrading monooxygenase HmoA
MIVRIWRTGLDESRAEEYDRFAAERSMPMFRRQDGFCGVLFSRVADGRAVITLWRDAQAIEALDAGADYRDTVAAIGSAGFLRPPQSVEVMTVDAGWLTSFGVERDQLP